MMMLRATGHTGWQDMVLGNLTRGILTILPTVQVLLSGALQVPSYLPGGAPIPGLRQLRRCSVHQGRRATSGSLLVAGPLAFGLLCAPVMRSYCAVVWGSAPMDNDILLNEAARPAIGHAHGRPSGNRSLCSRHYVQ